MDNGKNQPDRPKFIFPTTTANNLPSTSLSARPQQLSTNRILNETLRGPQGGLLDATFVSTRKPGKSPAELPPPESKDMKEKDEEEFKMLFAYNEYLQVLMKEHILDRQIAEQKKVLEGQVQYYRDLLHEKQQTVKDIWDDTDLIKNQCEVVEALEELEAKLGGLKNVFSDYQVNVHVEKLKEVLQKESDKITLKNVRPIQSQEEYDKLQDTFKKLFFILEKIINSGRDFEGTRALAEEIRRFCALQENVQKTSAQTQKAEKEAIMGLIAKLSEGFAKQYE